MIVAIALLALWDVTLANTQVDVIAVGGHVAKPGPYDRIQNESLAELINRIGGITVTQEELERYNSGETVSRVRINLYREGKINTFKIDPKSNELWELIIMEHDAVMVARAEPIEGVVYSATITLTKNEEAEQSASCNPLPAAEFR